MARLSSKASASSSTGTCPPASPASSATPPPDPSAALRFGLTGPSRTLDPRVDAYRRDIADVALAGRRFAPHYARPEPARLTAAATALRAEPADGATAVSQLVHGEAFGVLDVAGGWAWGRCAHDGYVGYLPVAALGTPAPAPATSPWRVAVAAATCFARADIKAPALGTLPVGARLDGTEEGAFLATPLGHVHRRHLLAPGAALPEPVEAAERLVGLAYLWGGRGGGGGIDCSGLVQVALGLAGIAAPRDSDQQRDALGTPLPDGAPLARGDLVFFPGHVGIMADGERLIHATAHWMRVVAEPLADVVARLAPEHPRPILARHRLAGRRA